MPLLAVLSAASHIARCINYSLLEQSQTKRTKIRCCHNVESTISIEQGRIVTIEFQAFFIDQKHWYTRAVFTVKENLLGLVVAPVCKPGVGRDQKKKKRWLWLILLF